MGWLATPFELRGGFSHEATPWPQEVARPPLRAEIFFDPKGWPNYPLGPWGG